MEIVVNEWLLDYMCPDTDSKKTSMAIQFINAVVKKCDKIVIGRTNPFVLKFYRYWKSFSWDTDSNKRFKRLHLLFRDSDKTIIIYDADIKKLPKEIEEKTPPDDKYLIELAYSSKDRIIVTTDQRLKEKLQGEVDLKIRLLEEFLGEYLS